MALAPLMGPSGGPLGGREAALSGFCSSVINLFRLVLGVSFEAREIILISPRDSMARQKPVHYFSDEAGHSVIADHPHHGFWRTLRRRRAGSLQLPAFQALDAVAIAESPLEHTRLLQCGHHRSVRNFALAQISRNLHFLRHGKIRGAILHFKIG